ncbi:hypothetical protein D3C81_2221890 [compost metagenome]
MASAKPRRGSMGWSSGVSSRLSKGPGVTSVTSSIIGKKTSRYRFREKAVNARISSRTQVQRLKARCRSKLSL